MPQNYKSNRPRVSKLALTLSLFFLSTLSASAGVEKRDGWRPYTELAGSKFVLGDGKNEGIKVKGYQGEWPIWSSFRSKSSGMDATTSVGNTPVGSIDTEGKGANGGNNATKYVCAPIGDCLRCPEDVVHLPYCRPYNNRRRTSCVPISSPSSPSAVKTALSLASSTSNTNSSREGGALLGWEACGKSAKEEGRDYFEMIAVIASIAIFSVWAFVQRQKLLFKRQNQMLQSRVTGQSGRRRGSGIPGQTTGFGRNGKGRGRMKRSARLGSRI